MENREVVRRVGDQSVHCQKTEIPGSENRGERGDGGINSRTFSLMNHVIAKASAERFRPEVLVKMPFDLYDDISDYAKAAEISEVGRELMKKALDEYEISLQAQNDN